jgi:adenylate cyclase 8
LFRIEIPAQIQLLMLILLFVYVVVYHSRLVEVTSRLDFLWKKQAERELSDMDEVRTYNSQLLRNILPDHVAMHFLLCEERRMDVRKPLQIPITRHLCLKMA